VPVHRVLQSLTGWFLAVVLALAALPRCVADDAKYSVRAWESDEGLPQNSVLSMVQTRDGYLWVGTFNGMVRFDGLRFTNMTPELNDRVVHLFEDSRRTLWIGTENSGTLALKDGRLTAPPELAAGGFDRRLRATCEDSNSAVWLLYENGDLWRYPPTGRPTAFVTPQEGITRTRTLMAESNGPVWIGTSRHQYAIGTVGDNGSFELPVSETDTFARLDALIGSRNGGYWRLANFQVQRVTGGVTRVVSHYRWPVEVSSACEDGDGNLVVGTRGAGVFIVKADGGVSVLSTNQQLSANGILSVLSDRDGTLWVGTDGGGLNRIRRQTFQTLEASRGWAVQSVAEDGAGNLWIGGSYKQGLGYWTNGTLVLYGGGAEPEPIQCVFVDREQRVWVSTPRKALYQIRNGRPEGVDDRGLIQDAIRAIHQDRAGRLWFGSLGGLLKLEGGVWKLFTAADGLTSTNVTALADDEDGNLWVGTARGGVFRWRDGAFEGLQKSEAAPGGEIMGLYVDKAGVLWVGTPSGLGRWKGGAWTRYTTRDGLLSDSLGYIIGDAIGNLWVASGAGLLRLPLQRLNEFAAGSVKTVACVSYGKADGLPTRECTFGSQPGAWRGSNDRLWFSTSKGVALLDVKQFRPNTNPPPVMIESVMIDDLAPTQSLTAASLVLQPSDERVEIRYTSLNLSAPDRARFRYRLEGHENNWTEAGNARVVRYSKLPPGQYRFQVTAANEDGIWNEAGAILGIEVLPPPPPLWKRWWFIAACVVLAVGVVAGSVHYLSTQRLERQLAVMRQQEALERERARIARDIHDQVGASLTQVALLGELVESDKDSPTDVQEHAQQISQTARETTRALDEIVWTVNPQNDTLDGLVNYICKNAQDYLAVAGVRYRFDVPAELPAKSVAPDVRHNIFLASKEAVTNVVRHAKASAAWIRLRLEPSSMILEIEDNGRGLGGLDPEAAQRRNGLKNMRKRMEDVGGSFEMLTGSEGGALVRLTVPLSRMEPLN
jgi:ligand-binding sensor domain-containing protein/signal transduction histidine kinase